MGALREDSPVYFPATSLRGALRRAGRNHIRRAAIRQSETDTPWSVDTHFMLTQGVDTTNQTLSEKTSGTIGLEEELRSANPFLSLFGRWKLPGHLGIDNAIPETENCVYVEGRGARPNDFNRDPGQVQFLNPEEAQRLKRILEQDSLAAKDVKEVDDEIKALKREVAGIRDKDEKAEVNERIKELDARKKEIKSAKEGSQETIQRIMEGFEAIVPGTQMNHRMVLQNANELELGLMLATLREFARSPYVGGHRALNCGEVSGQWVVKYWIEDADQPQVAGKVSFSAEGFEISDEPEEKPLTKALSDWDKTVASLSDYGIDFERFLLVA
jgi:CRISPR type IV-associated protein Csf2